MLYPPNNLVLVTCTRYAVIATVHCLSDFCNVDTLGLHRHHPTPITGSPLLVDCEATFHTKFTTTTVVVLIGAHDLESSVEPKTL